MVRFGALEAPLERGAVSPGTYCTRTYEECHRKPCKLQSPNYPGMYPRYIPRTPFIFYRLLSANKV